MTARRGKRRAPERGEIEPSAIRRSLGDVFVLEFGRDDGHPFRLAGTRVCALFGRELKNEPFLNLWDAETRPFVAQLVNAVADDTTGAVASVTGRTAEGWSQDLELLLLPLAHRGDNRARMIGHDAERRRIYGATVVFEESRGRHSNVRALCKRRIRNANRSHNFFDQRAKDVGMVVGRDALLDGGDSLQTRARVD